MQIAPNTVAQFHYTLTNDAGATLDSSRGGSPLSYLHGAGQIVPGLERQMAGRAQGDAFKAEVPAAEGYGERIAALVQQAAISMFPEDVRGEVKPGMQFQAESNMGPVLVTVVAVDGEQVTLDGNHALAGQTLHFDIEVVSVRAATAEELAHGHAHGEGGHQH
jgi:FKBP-type peptidyl-prolyl cis-trans isomerase SlyD